MRSSVKSYSIIVNLEFSELLGRYIPTPYIVKVEYGLKLGSLKAKATEITLPSYNIIIDHNVASNIVKLASALSMDVLEDKFTTKKRNQNTLVKVMLVPEIKDLLLKYFDRISGDLFQYSREKKIPYILDIERKTPLENLKIVAASKPILPILRFEKTQTGIKYALKLNNQQSEPWAPKSKDVHILTNHNSWIIADYVIYQLKDINGNKLKPFLKQEHIFIKNEMVLTYFKKFILEVARKSEIEAVGFEVKQYDEVKKCRLAPTYDFFNNELVMDLIFEYDGAQFSLGSPSKMRTRLNISDRDEISISQVKRNSKQEQDWLNKLLITGLKTTKSQNIKIEDEDNLGLISFLIQNKDKITKDGFELDSPVIDGKKISLDQQKIILSSKPKEDWFDIHGAVTIGKERIPFAQLLESIRNGDRYFPLSDGSYFLIPTSWMTKYGELAKFANGTGDKVKVRKSQYGFLEDIDEIAESINLPSVNNQIEDYIQSPNLNAKLRPYQETGVKWLLNHQTNGLGACLADDMGLGKTLQTIALLSYTKDNLKKSKKPSTGQMTLFAAEMMEEINPLRALIILPSSLVFNWKEEIRKFNKSLHTLEFVGAKRRKSIDSLDKFDVVLTTYHTVLRDIEKLRTINWEYVILDESQMIKNKNSKMFQVINEIPAENRLSLSGTPIENSLSDLWSQMQFINPEMLGSFSFFKKNYLTPIEKHQDQKALSQLARLIKPYILRRTKEEVAPELPALNEQIEFIILEKAQKEAYEKLKSATRNYLLGLDDSDKSFKFHVFVALTKLRQIANDPILVDPDYKGESDKKNHIVSKMEEVRKSGHKVLIFSAFTKLLDSFQKECIQRNWSYVSLTGKDNQKNRKASVDAFQKNEEVSFFFISLKAGGTGLNLTAADYVFILDPWWNPFAEKQAIARAHRIGQDKPVTVIRYIAKETIEEKILKLQKRKTNLSNDIIHFDEDKLALEKTDFEYLLN